jgi:hypothetical protein
MHIKGELMSSKFPKLQFNRVKTYSIKNRFSKVSKEAFAKPISPKETISTFIDSLPDILVGKDFKEVARYYRKAVQQENSIIWMIGAHVTKCGLNPIITNLLNKGYISHLALNGASAIHDIEIAMWGVTSEDVAEGLKNGSFGMAKETAEFINETLSRNKQNEKGYAELLAQELIQQRALNLNSSLLASAYQNNVPVSLHPALGTEIIHQHPNLDGAAFGEKSLIDFQIFSKSISRVSKGSLVLNIGSAVILPEVFLKALTIVRNLGYDAYGFHTAVFDMIRHYRPTVNVMQRPTQDGGKGYYFVGHHEIMIPLLSVAVQKAGKQ